MTGPSKTFKTLFYWRLLVAMMLDAIGSAWGQWRTAWKIGHANLDDRSQWTEVPENMLDYLRRIADGNEEQA